MNSMPVISQMTADGGAPRADTGTECRSQIYLLVAEFLKAHGLDEAAEMVCARHDVQETRSHSINWLGSPVAESSSKRVPRSPWPGDRTLS